MVSNYTQQDQFRLISYALVHSYKCTIDQFQVRKNISFPFPICNSHFFCSKVYFLTINKIHQRDLDPRQCESASLWQAKIRFNNKYSQNCVLSQQKQFEDDCLRLKICSLNRKVDVRLLASSPCGGIEVRTHQIDEKSGFRIFTQIWHRPILASNDHAKNVGLRKS